MSVEVIMVSTTIAAFILYIILPIYFCARSKKSDKLSAEKKKCVMKNNLTDIKNELKSCTLLVEDSRDLRDLYCYAIDTLAYYNKDFLDLPRITESKECSVPGLYYSIDALDSDLFNIDSDFYDLITIYDVGKDYKNCLFKLYFIYDGYPKISIMNNITKKVVNLSEVKGCSLRDLIERG